MPWQIEAGREWTCFISAPSLPLLIAVAIKGGQIEIRDGKKSLYTDLGLLLFQREALREAFLSKVESRGSQVQKGPVLLGR